MSGTLDAWAEGVAEEAELIVFLEAPTEIRIERLRQRERGRFGDMLPPGGAMHETHREFIEWAAQDEHGTQPGRSRPRHERWLAGLGHAGAPPRRHPPGGRSCVSRRFYDRRPSAARRALRIRIA